MTRHRLILAAAIALVALALPSVASAADRDHDRMRDSWEKRHGLSTKKNDARKDKDRDRLRNRDEYRLGTDPDDKDSDDDGVRDNREGAGTIKSFDTATGVLVIDLFGSDSDLTGKVAPTTKIECEDESDDDDHPTDGNTSGDTRGDGTPEDRKTRDGSDDGDRSGSNSGSSDDDGRRDDDDDDVCTADWLDPGRVVKEAELNTGDDGPNDVFDEIEIVK